MTQGLHTQEVAVARSWDGRSQEGTLGFRQGGCFVLQPPQTAALWRPQVRSRPLLPAARFWTLWSPHTRMDTSSPLQETVSIDLANIALL